VAQFMALHLPFWLWRPGRGYARLMTCPACRRRSWLSASWRPWNTERAIASLMGGLFATRIVASALEAAASKSTISASGWQGWILHLHGPVVYVVVAGLLFLEVGIVVGFFIPGEIATILAGSSRASITPIWPS